MFTEKVLSLLCRILIQPSSRRILPIPYLNTGYNQNMIKRISFLALLLTLFCTHRITLAAYEIAAVVNDRIISAADLEYRLKLALLSSGLEDSEEARKSLRDQILKMMIDEALQLSTAEKYDIKATDTEVLQAFNEFENRNNMQSGQLKALLTTNNIPLKVLYNQIRANLSWREYIHARYQGMVQIGEQDIDRSMKQFEVKKDKPQILVSEIFLSVESPESALKVEEKAREFVQELRKGAQFPALAQQFSQNASAARGGSIGWVAEDDLDSSLAQAIKNLQAGEVSDPVKTQNGYYILLVKDRRSSGESIGKDTLLSFMQVLFPASSPFSDESLQPIFNQAKSIAVNSKSCGLLKTLAKADKSIQMREVQKARMSDMAPQLKNMLLNLGIGTASEPLLTDMGFIVFMVCAKEEINPDNPTKDEVRGMLFEQKLEQLSQREMRDTRRAAHIDIRIAGDIS